MIESEKRSAAVRINIAHLIRFNFIIRFPQFKPSEKVFAPIKGMEIGTR
jgi:hypothetical protein